MFVDQRGGKKLVSIGLPTWNHASFIGQAIDALRAQTYPNIEITILDGASIDDTEKVVVFHTQGDSRVRYIKCEKAGGLVRDFGRVLDEAVGEYFMWAADDDWWDSRFIEVLVGRLDKHPECGVAMCAFTEHRSHPYSRSQLGKTFRHDYTGKSFYSVYRKMLEAKMNPIFLHGLYRRVYLKDLYRRLLPKCIDEFTIFTCEAALSTHFLSVPEVLHSKYRHPIALAERHTYIGAMYKGTLPWTKFFLKLLYWLCTSPNIPFYRKVFIFPPWISRMWRSKRKMFMEFRYLLIRKFVV